MLINKDIRKDTVLITGLNGYLAGRTAELLLHEGYRVRGTVRNQKSGEKTKAALLHLGYCAHDIDVLEITDLCRPGSLDEAAAGCIAIFHLASPLAEIWTLPPSEVVRIATESTARALGAATRANETMKSVVLMSSAAALFDMPMEERLYTENDWNTTSEQLVKQNGDEAGGFHAYLASKTAAEKVFWQFRDTYRPSFGTTTLQPTYFIGPPLIPWETAANIPYSNTDFWKVVSGEDIPGPMMIYGDTVDIRDVARMLLWSALNTSQSDGQRYICSSFVGGGQAIADILNRRMPSQKIQRGQPGQGYLPDYKPRAGISAFDASKAASAMKEDWIPYEESVVDMARFLQRYL
ncbi:hypothetical protein F4808DRAFT_448171 [Astrocystis sublimbata]|nr:hypothetical protein F4808DRAFT_448171 [Astrocystis sublimbata]